MGKFDKLKKIDLHCHLDGSLSIETMEKLAQNIQKELPVGKELAAKVQVSPDCRNLAEYLSCFDIPLQLLRTAQSFKESVLGVMRDAAKENVVYIEIRFSPVQSAGSGISYDEIIAAAVEGLQEGTRLYGVMGNLILCGMRHVSPQENIPIIKAGLPYLGKGVCAVDMAGNEAAFPIMQQKAFFEEAKKQGMPFTIHAGECGSAQSIRDALELGSSRIGHGIAAMKDPELMEILARKQTPLEMCPISNIQTRAVADETEYPFRKFLEAGLCLTVNTDNRTVSGTSLTREFEWLEKHYALTPQEAVLLTENAARAAFVSEEMRDKIMKKIV